MLCATGALSRLRELGHIQRGRHHHNAQVRTQGMLRLPAQGHGHIGMDAALMKLVEDHDAYTCERAVAVDHAGKDAFGHDLDAGLLRNAVLEADAVADGLAYLLAQQLRQSFGNGFGRQAPGLQHDDLLVFQPGSSSIASGSKVLLPAPGGAFTISVFCAERCSLTAGIISRTGRSMVNGLKGKSPTAATI
jgi:hypothetical protein